MKVPNEHRVKTGPWASDDSAGNNGMFVFTHAGMKFGVIASDKLGWEHVSVSLLGRSCTPTWEQMCFIKNMFWGEDETIVQYHPAKKDYVNMHPYCLHLWRPTTETMPTPPSWMVGLKDESK